MNAPELFPEQESLFSVEDQWKLAALEDQATEEDGRAALEVARWVK